MVQVIEKKTSTPIAMQRFKDTWTFKRPSHDHRPFELDFLNVIDDALWLEGQGYVAIAATITSVVEALRQRYSFEESGWISIWVHEKEIFNDAHRREFFTENGWLIHAHNVNREAIQMRRYVRPTVFLSDQDANECIRHRMRWF
jgi:hypothetical protein